MDSLHISGLSGNVVASGIDAVHQFAIAGTDHKVNALSLRWLGQASASIGGRIVADIKNGKMFQMASRGAAVFGTPAFSDRGVTCRPQLNFKAGEHQGLDLVSVDMEDDAGRKSHWGAAPGHEPQPPSMPRQAPLGSRQLIRNPLIATQLAFQASSHPSLRASAVVGSQTPTQSVPDNGALPLPPRLAPRGPRQLTNHPRAVSEPMPQATRLSDLKSTSFLGGHISAEPLATRPAKISVQQLIEKLRAETVPPQQQRVNLRRTTEPPQMGTDEFSAIRMQLPSALRPGASAVRPRAGEPNSAMEARMLFMSPATVFGVSSSEAAKFSNLQPMNSQFYGEERDEVFGTSVTYLNMQDRARFKVTIRDGKVFDADGKPFETRQASTAFKVNKGRAIFVMDAQGLIYISNEQTRGKFHHSSFFAGQPVAAAGDIGIENGVITAISRKSGHYRPTLEQLNQVVQQLADQNVSGIFVDEDLS
ncbi:hypothetical protein [Pseudomonas wuhanensis]|uniref:Uncharacterized protein n=2 Tax=Pseudomonas TaxID=286 RepID=A0ABY9GLG5_9PSED|nr:hypothetical protein [Pseudomonas sp. FP607]WLI16606.1 hypothetical protein PSH88_20370 [Pseudomonas sp. FP607]